jgi:class 3 adenylate cyclase/CHASE2 domain-containing sensor protein
MRKFSLPQWVTALGPTLVAASVGVFFAAWAYFAGYSGLEGTSINVRFHARNRFEPWKLPPTNIAFIDINDAALEANLKAPLGLTPERWPWPRTQWADLHYRFKANQIRPAAIVYDIVFDLADDTSIENRKGYTLEGSEREEVSTRDQDFQTAMQETPDVPAFLAALFRPQGTRKYLREEYQAPWRSTLKRETRVWQPLPVEFTRFGIPFQPSVHEPVCHASEVSIPWDSKWWASTMKDVAYEEVEAIGLAASLLQPAAGAGATTMDPETDGITRWGPLFFEYDDVLYPSLPLQVVLKFWGTPLEKVRFEEGVVIIPKPDGSEVRVPVDARKRILLNFRYPWPEAATEVTHGKETISGFTHVNYWRLIDGFDQLSNSPEVFSSTAAEKPFDPRTLDGKILIIGSSAMATYDLRATPIDERFPMVGTVGEIIRSIQQEDFLRMAPPWLNSLWIISGTLAVGLLAQFFAPDKHAIATFILSGAHAFSAYFLFTKAGIIVDFFHVSFAEIVAYAVVTLSQYMQVSSIFGRYVTPGVRRYLLSNRKALELGGQETEVSILFSDLSGFTSMSEKMQAPEVISILNEYFGPMFKIIIDEEQGTLDKLIGDAIMAYFGHPQPDPEHAVRAVTAALKMQRSLAELRETWEKQGKPAIRMRIGVNTGTVVAGNMGDRFRTDYSIIGDNVNLASRLESNAPVDGVLISESTHDLVKTRFKFKERDPIKVKNKEKPVKVYEVVDFA